MRRSARLAVAAVLALTSVARVGAEAVGGSATATMTTSCVDGFPTVVATVTVVDAPVTVRGSFVSGLGDGVLHGHLFEYVLAVGVHSAYFPVRASIDGSYWDGVTSHALFSGYFDMFSCEGATYTSLPAPARMLDTRTGETTVDGRFAGDGARPANSVLELAVAGRASVPTDAASVVLNVTAAGATATGYVAVYPCGTPPPATSNLNYAPGQTVANAAIAGIGNGGNVCLYTNSPVELIVDISGFFGSKTVFVPLATPARLMDTRLDGTTIDGIYVGGGPISAGNERSVQVAKRAGIPTRAASVVVNVTAVDAAQAGYAAVYTCGTPRPATSNLNFASGQTVASAVIAALGPYQRICIYSNASADFVVDATGYFPSYNWYRPLVAPARLLDTRPGQPNGDGQSAGNGSLPADHVLELPVAGRAGVPADAVTAVLTVTAVAATGDGYVTVYPCGATRPLASNLNFAIGQTVANTVISKVGDGGRICLYTNTATDLVVDISGTLG